MGICTTSNEKGKKNGNENIINYFKPLSENTFNMINKSLCKINTESNKDNSKGIGFFINIKLDKNIKCLVTNYPKITQNFIESKGIIIIHLEVNKLFAIELDPKKRFIKYLKNPYNITFIEILNSDLINNDIEFMDYDVDYIYDYQKYINKKIFILHHSLNFKEINIGKIINLKDFRFKFSSKSNHINPGYPIILFENKKLMGIYESNHNNSSYGIFIGEIIKELEKEEKILKEIEETIKKKKEGQNEEELKYEKENSDKNLVLNKKEIKNINLDKENQSNLNNQIKIKYKMNDEKKIKIFGYKFVDNNIDNCKLIIDGEEKEIIEYLEIENNQKKNIIEIHLKIINPLINISCMFSDCKQLYSINNISNLNTSKITRMNNLFFGCTSLAFIPDISNWDTSNVENMGDFFSGCSMIKSLPDISKWNTSKVTNMSYMFSGCELLTFLPDISNWDTSNVNNFSYMFYWCKSLSMIPNISKWDTGNATDMSWMFSDCSNLENIPNISNWNIENVTDMNHMFYGCSSLLSLPDISFWNTIKVKDMSYMFYGCSKLETFPDLNNWNISNLKDINHMFNGGKNYWKNKFNLTK